MVTPARTLNVAVAVTVPMRDAPHTGAEATCRATSSRRLVDQSLAPAVRPWLARHPRVHLHFTPTAGSWLNLVEAFFSIITRQVLCRGNFPTVADLITSIQRFVDAWNDRCTPFTGTKDPDTTIAKATDPRPRKTTTVSVAEH